MLAFAHVSAWTLLLMMAATAAAASIGTRESTALGRLVVQRPPGLAVLHPHTADADVLLQLGTGAFVHAIGGETRARETHMERRFVTDDTASACRTAMRFRLDGGRLYARNHAGLVAIGAPAVPPTPDVLAFPSPSRRPHRDTVFSVFSVFSVHDGALQWTHATRGTARFCLVARTDTLLAVFAPGAAPADCVPVQLLPVPTSVCPG